MKKFFLMTVGLLVALAVSAQTYNNPSQKPNDKRIRITKVERTSNATIVYLKYTSNSADAWSCIDAYPYLKDDATGKKYQATDALNFKWGTKYKGGNSTYKIEFPPLPKNTTSVTFREAAGVQNPFVISNIALKSQGQQKKSTESNAKKQTSSSGSKTYNNPRQTTNNKNIKVTKVIRTKEYTIVHFTYNITQYAFEGRPLSASRMSLVDDDTEDVYKAKKPLNFTNDKYYDVGNYTFKVQFPPLPRNVSVVRFRSVRYKNDQGAYEAWRVVLQLPPPAEESRSNSRSSDKTVNINVY